PGPAPAGEGSVPAQLQRRAARVEKTHQPEGLLHAHAAILRPPPEGTAEAGVDGKGGALPGARPDGAGTLRHGARFRGRRNRTLILLMFRETEARSFVMADTRKVADLHAVLEVSRRLGASSDLGELLRIIEQATLQVLDCERISI